MGQHQVAVAWIKGENKKKLTTYLINTANYFCLDVNNKKIILGITVIIMIMMIVIMIMIKTVMKIIRRTIIIITIVK